MGGEASSDGDAGNSGLGPDAMSVPALGEGVWGSCGCAAGAGCCCGAGDGGWLSVAVVSAEGVDATGGVGGDWALGDWEAPGASEVGVGVGGGVGCGAEVSSARMREV